MLLKERAATEGRPYSCLKPVQTKLWNYKVSSITLHWSMAHELYNQLSKYLDASYRRTKNYQQEVDFILRRVGNVPGRKILIDVACGSGGHG